MANQLLYPAHMSASGIDPPRLRWPPGELNGGASLILASSIRKSVQQHANRFGWDYNSMPRTEDYIYGLH